MSEGDIYDLFYGLKMAHDKQEQKAIDYYTERLNKLRQMIFNDEKLMETWEKIRVKLFCEVL